MMKSTQRALVVLSSAILIPGIVACQGADSSEEAAAESLVSEKSTDDFVELFGGGHFSYTPTGGPADLAASSDLVITGRVADIIPGRTYSKGLTTRVTFVVTVEQELTEAAQPSTVYVEMPVSGGLPAEAVRTYLPPDLQMAFYLVPALTANEAPVDDESAGRPAGQPLYMPVDPDGALVADSQTVERSDEAPNGSGPASGERERVIQLGDDQSYVEADLSDFLPPATSWPAEYVHQGEGD